MFCYKSKKAVNKSKKRNCFVNIHLGWRFFIIFTIILPVYNRKDCLSRAVESVLKQTYQDFELLIIDDGSNDGSDKVSDFYASIDKRVKVIHKNNEGVSSARNEGLRHANGDYILFLDSDDEFENTMLEEMFKIVEKFDYDLVICGISNLYYNEMNKLSRIENIIEKQKFVKGNYKILETFINLLKHNKLINGPVGKLYKKNIIKNNNIYFRSDVHLGEDILFNIAYCTYIDNIYFLDKPLYKVYLENKDSLSSRFWNEKINFIICIYQDIITWIEKTIVPNQTENLYSIVNGLLIKWIYSCFMDLFKPTCKFNNTEKKEFIRNVLLKDEVRQLILDARTNNPLFKYLRKLLLMKKVTIIYFMSKIMFFIKYKVMSFYRIIYRIINKYYSVFWFDAITDVDSFLKYIT